MRLLLACGVLFVADLLLALVLPAREAGAGTALRLPLPELVQRSELVLEAHVLAAEPREADGILATEYLLEVERTFKGQDQSYRTLRLPGGVRADGSGLLVPGVPHLAPGEEALLFLSAENARGLRLPTGLAQGKFGVQRLGDGTKHLVRDTAGLALVGPGGNAPGARTIEDYAGLVAGIEAALAQSGGAR
ncbi:MAG: hypothetical protein EXS08_11645 [Planctomycetes bacterium]|nr:hypothetical protein [Planctomycetota bacterium]